MLDDPRVARRVARLVARVEAAVDDAGGTPDRSAVTDLVTRHDDAPRRYHTTRHLDEMLVEADRLVRLLGRPVPSAVVVAVATHDAVYDPTADDNEARSAELATTLLAGWNVDPTTVGEVARLVGLTAEHDAAVEDPTGALVVDADLWILSAPADRYDRYVADVRREYAHVGEQAWRHGRGAVLDRLERRLATTGYLVGPDDDRARRTADARANLARERTTLTARRDHVE